MLAIHSAKFAKSWSPSSMSLNLSWLVHEVSTVQKFFRIPFIYDRKYGLWIIVTVSMCSILQVMYSASFWVAWKPCLCAIRASHRSFSVSRRTSSPWWRVSSCVGRSCLSVCCFCMIQVSYYGVFSVVIVYIYTDRVGRDLSMEGIWPYIIPNLTRKYWT